MPTTTNDSATSPLDGALDPVANGGAPSSASRRTDAIGAEIPVIVHASRYSAASKGAGKNLPPVHEETRTVIVFPAGAVVRLSASLTTGELVVLTNQQSGSDVICRVANVKAQPGIQNYVNLEFTQRAPNFWGSVLPAERPAERPTERVVERAGERAVERPFDRAEAPTTAAAVTPQAAPRPPISAPAAELISAVQAVTQLLGTVPLPAEPAAPAPFRAVTPAAPAAAPSPSATPALGSLQEHLEAALKSLAQLPGQSAAQTAPRAEQTPAAVQTAPAPKVEHPSVSGTVKQFPQPVAVTGPAQVAGGIPQAPAESRSVVMSGGLFSGAPAPAKQTALVAPNAAADAMSHAAAISAQDPRHAIALHVAQPEAPADSKKLLLTIAAGVVLFVVGAAGGAVLFRQNRSETTTASSASAQQPVVNSQAAAPVAAAQPELDRTSDRLTSDRSASERSADSSRALVPAVATSSDVSRAETLERSAPARTPSDSPVAKAAVAAPAQHIALGKLSAPIAKTASGLNSSEPPPTLGGQAVNLMGNGAFGSEARPNAPAAPVVARSNATVQQLKPLFSPSADYPPIARAERVEGTVVLDALVDPSGKVTTVKVISGPPLLQQAAMDAVHTWKYAPAQVDGQPVAVHTQVEVSFRLR